MPRGGRREGAGRPAKPSEDRKVQFNRRLSPESVAKLKAMAAGYGLSDVAIIERLIDEAQL